MEIPVETGNITDKSCYNNDEIGKAHNEDLRSELWVWFHF